MSSSLGANKVCEVNSKVYEEGGKMSDKVRAEFFVKVGIGEGK